METKKKILNGFNLRLPVAQLLKITWGKTFIQKMTNCRWCFLYFSVFYVSTFVLKRKSNWTVVIAVRNNERSHLRKN